MVQPDQLNYPHKTAANSCCIWLSFTIFIATAFISKPSLCYIIITQILTSKGNVHIFPQALCLTLLDYLAHQLILI